MFSVPHKTSQRCCAPRPFEAGADSFLQTLPSPASSNVLALLGTQSASTLRAVNRATCLWLDIQVFWTQRLRFKVLNAVQLPANFSFFRLCSTIQQARKHSQLTRQILSGLGPDPEAELAREAAQSQTATLYVCMEPADETEYWSDRFSSLLNTTAVPTEEQRLAVEAAVVELLRPRSDGLPPLQTPEKVVELALGPRANKVLQALVFALVCLPAGCRLSPENPVNDETKQDAHAHAHTIEARSGPENAHKLLRDVGIIKNAYGFLFGLKCDEVVSPKWPKLSKRARLGKGVARLFVSALCQLSFVQLTHMFRMPGLIKSIFRHLHTGHMVSHMVARGHGGFAAKRVHLMLAALHGRKYPATVEEFEACRWADLMTEPLRQMAAHKAFAQPEHPGWLETTFCHELAGRRLTLPPQATVSAMLAQFGNTRETWRKLLDADILTAEQIIAHIRSMVLLDLPIEEIAKRMVPESSSGESKSIDLNKIARLQSVLTSGILSDEGIEALVQLKESASPVDGSPGLISVPDVPMSFRDKKGQAVQKKRRKVIAEDFNLVSVERFRSIGQLIIDKQVDQASSIPSVVAAIPVTHELKMNVVRTGIPPKTPDYAPVSMFRGEGIALERLTAGEPKRELLVGITWCQKPSGPRVDLDLSVIVFDEDWNQLDQCSYTRTQASGLKHSGDLTSAPYPEGARETVHIKLDELKEGATYVALCVYNYTRQPMDDVCHDASCFVADPAIPGTGPGGISVIAAASLKSGAQSILGSLLILNSSKGGVNSFICCDQQFTGGNSTESSLNQVARTAKVVLDDSGIVSDAPTSKMRLSQVASLAAAQIADVVIIESGSGTNVLRRDPSQPRSLFYRTIREQVASAEPILVPSYNYSAGKLPPQLRQLLPATASLVVFGEEFEHKNVDPIVKNSLSLTNGADKFCVVVNLRSNQESIELRAASKGDFWAVNVAGVNADLAARAALEQAASAQEEGVAASTAAMGEAKQ